MLAYIVTDSSDKSGKWQWGENVTNTAVGKNNIASGSWICCYSDPVLAVMCNPAHGGFDPYHVWEAEIDGVDVEEWCRYGVCQATTTRMVIPTPLVTEAQRMRWGILCAKAVCSDPTWIAWADNWLAGVNRMAVDSASTETVDQAKAAASHASSLSASLSGLGAGQAGSMICEAEAEIKFGTARRSPAIRVIDALWWVAESAAKNPVPFVVDFAALARQAIADEK